MENLPDSPEDFGPIMWDYLHRYAKENPYTEEFLNDFIKKIPCSDCKNSFSKFKRPIITDNFEKWVYDRHNDVNTKLNKKIFTPMDYLNKYDSHIIDNNKFY